MKRSSFKMIFFALIISPGRVYCMPAALLLVLKMKVAQIEELSLLCPESEGDTN